MAAFNLTEADLQRVCRDIAWSELSTLPHVRSQIGARLGSDASHLAALALAGSAVHSHSWAADEIDADSLTRMQLATAAATWCNAYDAGFEDLFLAKRNTLDWAEVMRRARAAGAAHFTFASSGSSGERKHIRHREEILASEAMAWAQIVNDKALPAVERIVVLVPTHHIYGFIWGVLLPHALDKPAIEADLTALPDLRTGDLIIAVPDQWAWLAEAADTQKIWPSGVQGASSTAPLPDLVHSKLIAKNQYNTSPLSRLLQIYGSSETAGLAYRANPNSPYTLAPGRTRQRDSNGDSSIQLLLPNGEQATLAVQDELQWVSDTDFKLLRRSDHSVQIGGHNVSPDWVVTQLLKNPLLKEASVRLNTEVQPVKLKAFIVLNDENTPSAQTVLEQWITDTLPHYATFSSIVYGTELPRSATGKLSDWQS